MIIKHLFYFCKGFHVFGISEKTMCEKRGLEMQERHAGQADCPAAPGAGGTGGNTPRPGFG
jgi:hypothetical protein